MFLYEIRNIKNNKVYIGQTIRTPGRRWAVHKCDLNHNRHDNDYLQRAWNKYGPACFVFSVIATASSREELDSLEQTHIKKADGSVYNLVSGGSFGRIVSEETKKKMSDHMTGIKRSPEYVEFRRQYMLKNNPMSNKRHRDKIATKLSDIEVIEIRQSYRKGDGYANLAKKYNVGPSTIGRIVNYQTRMYVENQ